MLSLKTDIMIDLQKSNIIFEVLSKNRSFYLKNSAENIHAAIVGIPENVSEYIVNAILAMSFLINVSLHYIVKKYPTFILSCFTQLSPMKPKKPNVIIDIVFVALIILLKSLIMKKPKQDNFEYNNEVQDVVDNAMLIQISNREEFESQRMQNYYINKYKEKRKFRLRNEFLNDSITLIIGVIFQLSKVVMQKPSPREVIDLFHDAVNTWNIIAQIEAALSAWRNFKPIEKDLAWQLKLLEKGKIPRLVKPLKKLKIINPSIDIDIVEFGYGM